MATEMTPQERAAAVLDQMVVNVLPRDARDYNEQVIENALRHARRAALLECAKVAREFPWEQPAVHADPLRQARCRGNREASSDIAAALDRLAQEG